MRRLSVNLAATPFINRPALIAMLGAAGGLAVILTLLNLASFILLGRDYRAGRALMKDQEQRIASLQKDITEKQALMGSAAVATFSYEAVFLDEVLKAKRFSWVTFLEDLERVKPYGTAFEGIQPSVDNEGGIRVTLRGQANQRPELFKLENNLFADPHFRDVILQTEAKDQSGGPFIEFQVSFEYLPGGATHAP